MSERPPVAPARTSEQRRAAAALAVRLRADRAAIRADLAAGRTTLAGVLASGSHGAGDARGSLAGHEAAAGMRVRVLLESLPGVGERRADAVMAQLGIPPTRRVRGLGPRQRAALVEWADRRR